MLSADANLQFKLYKGNEKKWIRAHQLVATAFIPNPDLKPEVNHIDGHKFNNYVENLEWATPSENTKHAHDNELAKISQRGRHHSREIAKWLAASA